MALPTKIHQISNLLTVFISSSRCIYENLALEEWLFRNNGVKEDGDSLLIWRNSPAVVIGRYQNPWLESDVRFCAANDIRIARRYSGGGAVYHDEGNLNISLMTTHERHSRKKNLQIVADFLNAELFGGCASATAPRLSANERDDLLIEPSGAKVSGTAARIARGRAYHHFTLLVDVDIGTVRRALKSPFDDQRIQTNASRSVRAKSVDCLTQHLKQNAEGNAEKVADSVLRAFVSQYKSSELVRWDGEMDKFEGLDAILNSLRSDEWIYGKTPKFTLQLNDNGAICVENGLICGSSHAKFKEGIPFHIAFQLTNLE
ncbi:hypothetical protein niasHT_008117 [Heterodera trifolii]|uniref:BPL/LPL catalytic domain-containing protein n=1 Tax=Heterodera trifolii TaxID=157864 RepID=A0ABD2LZZ1_9BILA